MSLIALEELRKLIHPYFIVNIFLALAYVTTKYFTPLCLLLHPASDCELDFRETEILTFLVIVIFFRTRKYGSTSMVPYISSACMYAKIANILLFFYADPRMGIIYLVVCIIQAVLLPEPSYGGPDYVSYFRGTALDEELEKDKRVSWLITFYAAWNPVCVNLAPVFSELSAKYGLDNLKFGKVDVGRFPDAADKYCISTSPFSQQLPTIVLFRGGKEIGRRPVVDNKGKVIKVFFSKENIISEFNLNNLYEECKKNPIKKNKKLDPAPSEEQKKEN